LSSAAGIFFGLFEASPAAQEMPVYEPEEFRRMLDVTILSW
jgi:hypothetical protein